MHLQTHKLAEYILKRETKNFSKFNPFTIDELIKRIEKSEEDYKNGRFKSHDGLEKISTKW